MSDKLAAIQQALDRFQRDEARALLREELKENPSADAYYLAAQAARTEGDRIKHLRRALELDPDHQPAAAELDAPRADQKPEPATAVERVELPATPTTELRLASIRKRWLAIIIDGFIVAVFTVMLLLAGGALAPLDAAFTSADEAALSEAFSNLQSNTLAVNLLVSAVYNVALMVWFNGRTLGKMMLRLRVVKKNGGRITILDALLRNVFGYMISQIFQLGFLWALFDKEKQAWHDKMAGTVVVEEERTAPSP